MESSKVLPEFPLKDEKLLGKNRIDESRRLHMRIRKEAGHYPVIALWSAFFLVHFAPVTVAKRTGPFVQQTPFLRDHLAGTGQEYEIFLS